MINRITENLPNLPLGRIHSFVVNAVTIDDKISTVMPTVINILTGLKDYVPGGVHTIKRIKGLSEYLGILTYLDSLVNLATGKTFTKNVEKPIKLTASLIKFMTSTSGYLLTAASLLSAHPYVATAIAVAKVANRVLLAYGLGLNIASMATEGKESLKWNQYVQMIALASIVYLLVAPLLMTNPPALVFVGAVANITMGTLFLWDVGSTVYNYLNPPRSVEVSYIKAFKEIDQAFMEEGEVYG